jgi:hypothetical protein
MNEQITHYRYERDYNFLDRVSFREIGLVQFTTIKETKCGYWICRKGWYSYKDSYVFVLKESRKRYAYPTKKEAFHNFKLRTEKSLEICKNNLESAKIFLKLIDKYEIK